MSVPVPQPHGADPGWPALELVGDALVKYYDELGYPVARPYAAAEAVLTALDAAGLLLTPERRQEIRAETLREASDDLKAKAERLGGSLALTWVSDFLRQRAEGVDPDV